MLLLIISSSGVISQENSNNIQSKQIHDFIDIAKKKIDDFSQKIANNYLIDITFNGFSDEKIKIYFANEVVASEYFNKIIKDLKIF